MAMSTIKGPAIYLAQFLGDAAPFDSLGAICGWAASLGYEGVQLPTWDKRHFDLERAAGSKDYCDEVAETARRHGVVITELSTHLQGQLVAVHPAYDEGFDAAKFNAALKEKGYPAAADKNAINWPMTMLILFIMLIYVTMVYGPIAAFLVEMFPTKIRYTSMSLPYHIGNGWFGGMLPLLATAMVAASGDIYYGLWYPIVVALMTFVIGLLFLKDRKDIDLHADESAYT